MAKAESSTAGPSSAGVSLLNQTTRSFEYAEMNIRHLPGGEETTINVVKRAIRMGYDTVVINRDIGLYGPESNGDDDENGGSSPPPVKKAKKGGRQSEVTPIPDPFIIDEAHLNLTPFQSAGKRFRQYSRLTVTLSDTSFVHGFFQSPQLRKYDVIAIRPGNDQIFTTLSRKTQDFDVMTFDQAASRVTWLVGGNAKTVRKMAEDGIGFEIAYADALKDSSMRRQAFANGRLLLGATRRRNVFIASAAEEILDLRAPPDVMNMLCLFGVSSEKARPHLSNYPRDILLRAEAKRTLKGAVAVSDKKRVPSSALSSEAALARLLNVPEFFIQIEKVPPKSATVAMEDSDAVPETPKEAKTKKGKKGSKTAGNTGQEDEPMDTLEMHV